MKSVLSESFMFVELGNEIPLWEITLNLDCGNVINLDRNSSIHIMKLFLPQSSL